MSKWLSAGLLALFGGTVNASLDLGFELPDVVANDQSGAQIKLKSLRQEPFLLVYFYPKADTPGCTKQACSLRDAYSDLQDKGVKVIGVSRDSVAGQKAFADKFNLPFTLLADVDGVVVKSFGVPSMGNFAKRQAFLFQKGKLIWKDESASTEQQAQDVLTVLTQS